MQLFSASCDVHQQLQSLNLPNLVTIHDCWYCLPDEAKSPDADVSALGGTTVNVIQDFVPGAVSLKDYLTNAPVHDEDEDVPNHDEKHHLDPAIVNRNLLSVLAQVLGTVQVMWDNDLFHNDLHADNVLLVPMPRNFNATYVVGDVPIRVAGVGRGGPPDGMLAKIIDYGLATSGYTLDPKYRRATTGPGPWVDICQLVAGIRKFGGRSLPPDYDALWSRACAFTLTAARANSQPAVPANGASQRAAMQRLGTTLAGLIRAGNEKLTARR